MKLVDESQLITTKADEIQEMVVQELNRSDQWLLVLDNLDEASHFSKAFSQNDEDHDMS